MSASLGASRLLSGKPVVRGLRLTLDAERYQTKEGKYLREEDKKSRKHRLRLDERGESNGWSPTKKSGEKKWAGGGTNETRVKKEGPLSTVKGQGFHSGRNRDGEKVKIERGGRRANEQVKIASTRATQDGKGVWGGGGIHRRRLVKNKVRVEDRGQHGE